MTWKTKAYLTFIGLVVGCLVYLWSLPLGTFTEGKAEGADLIGRVVFTLFAVLQVYVIFSRNFCWKCKKLWAIEVIDDQDLPADKERAVCTLCGNKKIRANVNYGSGDAGDADV